MKSQPITLIHCAAVQDAANINIRNASIAISSGRIVWVGPRGQLPEDLAQYVVNEQSYDDLLVTPAHVNAHVHLDLTHVGPQPFSGCFGDWLRGIRRIRTEKAIPVKEAVAQGVRLSRDAGVGYAADIAGTVEAIEARRELAELMPLAGVSYMEWFGIGEMAEPRGEVQEQKLREVPYETSVSGHTRGIVAGIQPHAPYSTGRQVYMRAAKLSRQRAYRLSTHMAESMEELEFVAKGSGLFRQFLDEMEMWDESILEQGIGEGLHPVEFLERQLQRGRWLLAHCNFLADKHIEILAETGTSVAYCPIASDYFGHTGQGGKHAAVWENGECKDGGTEGDSGGRHRYREMLARGVNVALGVDSVICQPEDEGQAMGILPQMRYLYERDEMYGEEDAGLLLRMATVNGMLGMDMPEEDVLLLEGSPAVFCGVVFNPEEGTDPLVQVMENHEPARLLDFSMVQIPE
ncbi:Adenosine deaminase [Poriferisphaera corsica]|uniref:Adenosine deaminase n=1 Tax=Poriferisphaera corsica TaxID=2528020 RepID=A0A517YS84_9BACT|nr:amidohydrolase family protein [Poriferisphaera corsica]QDU33089.1 Adenosine deaminase [Poriferisphaera corsica]